MKLSVGQSEVDVNKIFTVLKNEFQTVVMRKSFILTLVLLPLTGFVVLLVVSALQKSSGVAAGEFLNELFTPEEKQAAEGYIDFSGLMKSIPPGNEEMLVKMNSEKEAADAVRDGTISAYYVIPEDFMDSGDIIYVRPDYNPLGGSEESGVINALVAYNLTGENLELTYRVQDPLNLTEVDISNAMVRESENWLTYVLPYAITYLFYIVILTSSTLLLNSITSEKQNRVMEILMTSVTPRQMLTGKIIALGLAGLLQTVVWLGSGLLMLRYSGSAFALSSAFLLPASTLLWGVVFFVLGYALYASLMAGIGALVPNMREASQLTTIVIMPMIVPLIFISSLTTTPNSPLSVFLSLFPLTSPVSMMTRLSGATVPLWQIGIAVLLLAVSVVLLVRASAGLFRAQNLLSGSSVSTKNFIKALVGK